LGKMADYKTCGEKIPIGEEKYAHFGKEKKNFFMKNVIIIITVCILLSGSVSGCSSNGSKASTSNTIVTTTNKDTANTENTNTIDGWKQNGSTYNFYKNGQKVIGWLSYGGVWYHFNSSGGMETGWISDGSSKYYLNQNGGMESNKWTTIAGKQYYFNSDGSLAINTTTPDGFIVGSDGAWTGKTRIAATQSTSQQSSQSSSYVPKSQNNNYTVYITKTGGKYHRAGCRYLSRSQISISKSDAINEGYTPCSVCNP